MKNIWTIDQTSKGKKATLITYWCKLNKHKNQKDEPKEIKRHRKSKSENTCPGRLRVKIFNGDDEVHYHQVVKHSHLLDRNDALKLPATVEAAVAQEVIKGYESPAIVNAVKQTQDYSRYLETQDVRNIKNRVVESAPNPYVALASVTADHKNMLDNMAGDEEILFKPVSTGVVWCNRRIVTEN